MKLFKYSILLFIIILLSGGTGCLKEKPASGLETGIALSDIKSHIGFLAGDELKGRETGTAGEARAANYIADHFKRFGLIPLGDNNTYFQEFNVNMSILNNPHSPDSVDSPDEERIARNIVGMIEGEQQPDSYIIIGAHYDHLGMGRFGSLYNREDPQIHNGADDNASGTAGVLELAQYFSTHRPEQSLIFAAFSGEEMGLLGSQHFVGHPPVELEQVEAMINMDMIGRLNENKLIIFGVGSSNRWTSLVEQANIDSLTIQTVPDGAGSSDHTSFYNKQIPVLHYFTDTHADYHRPSDDPEYINYEGEKTVLQHVKRIVEQLAGSASEPLAFTEAPVTQNRNVTIQGVTLGVTPDYGFDGKGMRITGTRNGGPAETAGLRGGDVIIKLNGRELKDIYGYMKVLNELEEGQSSTVTVLRDNREITFDLQL